MATIRINTTTSPEDYRLALKVLHPEFASFKPGQEEVIRSVMAGNNTLSIMPTGYGKTLCFQIPVYIGMKPAIVVSPLIALMMDQVRLNDNRLIPAGLINSAQSPEEREKAMSDYREGKIDILYVAPERLSDTFFLTGVTEYAKRKPKLVVVDEAHCVTDWGHDFRPEYLNIANFLKKIGPVPVLAQTATASTKTRDEIQAAFKISDSAVCHGLKTHRDNLEINISRFDSKAEKDSALLSFIKSTAGPGLVYTTGKEVAEKFAAEYSKLGLKADYFHADRKPSDKNKILRAFSESKLDVLFCTNAFGMGINMPHVRFVVHYRMPASFDQYVQEIGRVGRDGQPAKCELSCLQQDVSLQERFIKESFPEGKALDEKVADLLTTYNKSGLKKMPKFGDESKTDYVVAKHLISLGYLEFEGEMLTAVELSEGSRIPKGYIVEDGAILTAKSAKSLNLSETEVLHKLYRLHFEGKLNIRSRSDLYLGYKIKKSSISAGDLAKIHKELDEIRKFKRTRLKDLEDYSCLKSPAARINAIDTYFA